MSQNKTLTADMNQSWEPFEAWIHLKEKERLIQFSEISSMKFTVKEIQKLLQLSVRGARQN